MNWQPTANSLIVHRDPPEATMGVIILPDTAQRRQTSGVIVAMGPICIITSKVFRVAEVGDRVMFDIIDGTEFHAEGSSDMRPYVILRDDEVRAVFEEKIPN